MVASTWGKEFRTRVISSTAGTFLSKCLVKLWLMSEVSGGPSCLSAAVTRVFLHVYSKVSLIVYGL